MTIKVAIVGASGETGQSIVNGLILSKDSFSITALVRPASINKPEVQRIKDQGVAVVAIELDAPQDDLVRALAGQDVVICCIIPDSATLQKGLADAAKAAGVKRFVPSAFATACPPEGIMALREIKEDVINHIKKIYLPYTVIDVGWWYQSSLPALPSGRTDYAHKFPVRTIAGDGTLPTALTDLRDVGKYVARIIVDPRTLNRSVFVYNEVRTQEDIFALLEAASGEAIPRERQPPAVIEAAVAAARKPYYDQNDRSFASLLRLAVAQYPHSIWLRGDNTPEAAAYLGYLSGKELYPDMEAEYVRFEDYVGEVLAGKAKAPYANRTFDFGTKNGGDAE
ncbi:hypothetical protein AK830_g8063 [Neonectria ditissima]|uniref:NmrA-like domain-containing protein n=1 Tax=Neonectria ditissima TaxID=78410 RepID=A0A0P7BDI6_9HYPO|nr:hypothetical protein AK830_g8063 [Neonectria ditissima]